MKDRLYIKIAAMLLGIVVLSVAVTAFVSPPRHTSDDTLVVTSFYPVYIAALQVAGDIDGVDVLNLVENTAGCLHDYALEPRQLVRLDKADVFVLNGAGAEPFLAAALAARPTLTVVDLSAGQALLESGHVHDHEHEHEVHEDMAVNSHLWVSPLRYRQQVQTLCEGLAAADPTHEAAYRANAAAYLAKIDALWARMQQAAQPLSAVPSVLYHDSLLYLAEDLGLSVAASLNIGEDTHADPTARAAAERALKEAELAVLWYDDQYDVENDTLRDLAQTTAVMTVDTAVSGDGERDDWLTAMTVLCEAMEALT